MDKVQLRASASFTIGLLMIAAATASHAQTAASDAGAAETASDAKTAAATGTNAQEIVVTGSRLSASGFNTPTPVTVLGAAAIEQRAPANIADVVNEAPAFHISRSDTTRGGTDSQPGVQNTLDLRGLTDLRTLTLINGHRVVGTNPRGSVDTNIIPVGLVDRVEVVTGGASAAYGSDAVAGVANFILKNHLQGLQATVENGITNYGDGGTHTATIAGGTKFAGDRGHVVFGADFNHSDAIDSLYSRPWGRREVSPISRSAALRAPTNEPATVIATGVEPGTSSVGGLVQTAIGGRLYSFDGSGNPVVFNQGTLYGTSMVGSTANYGYNQLTVNPLRTPTQRLVAYGRAEYDLTDHVTAYVEANYAHTKTYPFKTADYISASGATPLLTVYQSVYPTQFAKLQALGLPATTTSLQLGRIDADFGGNVAWSNDTVKRGVVGLTGNFGSSWKWEVYYQSGRTTENFATTGLVSAALQKAVNGCANTGLTAAQLAQIATYEAGSGKSCVPFNPFGGAQNSAAAYNYFLNNQTQVEKLGQDVGSATISGSLFSLPAGEVSVAGGAEYRRETLAAISDPLTGIGTLYSQGNFTAYSGHQHVKEGFLEIGVPLLKNVFLAKSLDLNAAARRTDYQLSGAVTTWKFGGTWQPFDALRLRVTRSRDIRAPTPQELTFQGGATSGSAVNDIPVGRTGANSTVSTVAPSTTSYPVTNAGYGNPNLVPEIADTITGGAVVQFGRFHASVDYYHVQLKGAIVRLSTQQTIDQCRDGVASQCANITFDSSALGIASVINRSTNSQTLTVSGFDFEAAYRVPAPFNIGGTVELRALVNYEPHNKIYSPPTGITTEQAGTLAQTPKWNGTVTVGYSNQHFDFDLQFRGFDHLRGNPVLTGSTATVLGPEDDGYNASSAYSVSKNRYAGRIYINPSLQVKVSHSFTVFGVIDNLLNTAPPELATNSSSAPNIPYDMIGRRFRVGVRASIL